jgi:nucleotide-binding universal stress UspA family protein
MDTTLWALFALAVTNARRDLARLPPRQLTTRRGAARRDHRPLGREAFEAGARATAEKYLNIVKHEAAAAKVRCATDYAASDLLHRAIIKAARAKKCDLIIMASHGRRGWSALLLGSERRPRR